MPSLFTRIITGELPGRFVYSDPRVVAFLTIAPVRPGHTLVVPRIEVDDWLELDEATSQALFEVSRTVGKAVARAFPSRKVALVAVGLEVPHVHLHLIPIDSEEELDFRRAEKSPAAAALDEAQARIRAAME